PRAAATLLAQGGNAPMPTRLQYKLMLLPCPDNVLAKEPAAPVLRYVRNVPLEKFDVALPKAAVMMGSGTSPGRPRFANVFPLPAALFTARLFCALWNSFRNPFSKILTSLMLYPSH